MNVIDTLRIISINIIRAVVYKLAVVVTAFVLFVTGCSSEKKGTDDVGKFPVMHPVFADTVFGKEYVAEIQSIQNVELRARVGGFIENIHVDEGESVKAGQLLFTLSSQAFRDDLQKANASLKSAIAESKVAEVELKSTRKLVEKNIIAQTELELAEAKLESIHATIDEARSAVSTAQLNLSFTAIKAPFAGVINRIPNKAGSLVEEGALLTRISNTQEVFAYFNLSEQEYLNFVRQKHSGESKEVSLITADNKVYEEHGKIETVESEIDRATGTIAFRARFGNPSQLLRHGASGKVVLNTVLKNALLVPQKSTFEIQENLYVFVVNKENVVEMRNIVPAMRLPHVYVVQSGLSADDQIIYEGIQRVNQGDKVIPEKISFSKSGTSSIANR